MKACPTLQRGFPVVLALLKIFGIGKELPSIFLLKLGLCFGLCSRKSFAVVSSPSQAQKVSVWKCTKNKGTLHCFELWFSAYLSAMCRCLQSFLHECPHADFLQRTYREFEGLIVFFLEPLGPVGYGTLQSIVNSFAHYTQVTHELWCVAGTSTMCTIIAHVLQTYHAFRVDRSVRHIVRKSVR